MEELELTCISFTGSTWVIENPEVLTLENLNEEIYPMEHPVVLKESKFTRGKSVVYVKGHMDILFSGNDSKYGNYGNMWYSPN